MRRGAGEGKARRGLRRGRAVGASHRLVPGRGRCLLIPPPRAAVGRVDRLSERSDAKEIGVGGFAKIVVVKRAPVISPTRLFASLGATLPTVRFAHGGRDKKAKAPPALLL